MKATILFVFVAIGMSSVVAQTPAPTPVAPAVSGIWVFNMSCPKREYAVRLDTIQTITLQDYDMRRDGTLRRIVEVSVETSGANRVRFYWEDEKRPMVGLPSNLEEKRKEVENAVKELANIPDQSESRAVKDYPLATHSEWTEFKLKSKEDVVLVHDQLMSAWAGRKSEK